MTAMVNIAFEEGLCLDPHEAVTLDYQNILSIIILLHCIIISSNHI